MSNQSASHAKHLYRPDIDGLRAIAVLSVVVFHAFPNILTGGFLGVDVFFVISGYLITSIIYESTSSHSYSNIDFYTRRIARIFPSLVLVMICSVTFGWYVLLSNEFKSLGGQIASGAGFISNIFLWAQSGYFDSESDLKPMLHLWSLAVEEQFYLFWPILFILFQRNKEHLIRSIYVIGLGSFLICIYLSQVERAAAFYFPFTRFWELVIGSILALPTGKDSFPSRRIQNAKSIFGVTALIASILLISPVDIFPGYLALAPTIGTALIISAGPFGIINRYILSTKVAVWIGLISYPLYLWHWPLLVFSRIVYGEALPGSTRLIVVVTAILLAWITFRWVELPIRISMVRSRIAIASGTLMTSIGCLGVAIYLELIPPRNNELRVEAIVSALGDWDHPKHLRKQFLPVDHFYLNGNGTATTLFLGDSHIEQYSPRLVQTLMRNPKDHNNILYITSGGCPPIPNVLEDAPIHSKCERTRSFALNLIRTDQKIRTVVIGAFWNSYFIKDTDPNKEGMSDFEYYVLQDGKKVHFRNGMGASIALDNLEYLIRSISKEKKVYLILDNPSGPGFNPRTYITGSRFSQILASPSVSLIPQDGRQLKLNERLREIASRSNAHIIDPSEFLCKDRSCIAFSENGTPIYKDENHIRPFFLRDHADIFDQTLASSPN